MDVLAPFTLLGAWTIGDGRFRVCYVPIPRSFLDFQRALARDKNRPRLCRRLKPAKKYEECTIRHD